MTTYSSIRATYSPGDCKESDKTEWLTLSFSRLIQTLTIEQFILVDFCFLLLEGFISVQFSRSVVSDYLQPRESQQTRPPCPQSTPGIHPNSRLSSRWCHLILCRPLLLLPPIPPSIKVFSNESTLRMKWPNYWGFRFSISLSNEHPGLISFRMVWLDLLAV